MAPQLPKRSVIERSIARLSFAYNPDFRILRIRTLRPEGLQAALRRVPQLKGRSQGAALFFRQFFPCVLAADTPQLRTNAASEWFFALCQRAKCSSLAPIARACSHLRVTKTVARGTSGDRPSALYEIIGLRSSLRWFDRSQTRFLRASQAKWRAAHTSCHRRFHLPSRHPGRNSNISRRRRIWPVLSTRC